MPLLPLDIWRAEIGLNPWLFWGLADNSTIIDQSKCSGLLREYSWQGSDTAGRDDLRKAIERAEEKLFSYLGYRVAPQYVETEPLPWPRWNDASQVRYRDMDATGRRVAMQAPEFHIQAMGVEQLTSIGTAGLALLDALRRRSERDLDGADRHHGRPTRTRSRCTLRPPIG
jgi:hypothetical protein